MSEHAIRALDATTWDAFAQLVERHNGCGFGGCWCTSLHPREGRPEDEKGHREDGRPVPSRPLVAPTSTELG
jgi:hypothetical protein